MILATGASPRKLGCPAKRLLPGRACPTAPPATVRFSAGLEVYVVGGGDSAVEEALF